MSRARHLVGRFVSSLAAPALDDADLTFVKLQLTTEELAVWSTLGRADRAESVAVARRVAVAIGRDVDPDYLAAALLHDVGKVDAELGTFGRGGATVVAALVSHGRARAWPNQIGAYVAHDERGADKLRAAGARPTAVAWAAAHHRPERYAATGIPPEICVVLAQADGEDRSA